MDQVLAVAAQALSRGEPMRALKLVALRQDAQAVALRATALAQLGEYPQATQLFKHAAKQLLRSSPLAHARCIVALAELALATRELGQGDAGLSRAIDVLVRHRDLANAQHAHVLHARHALALGKLDLAEQRLRAIDARAARPALRALLALTHAELALRRRRPDDARSALSAAGQAAVRAQVPALLAEVQAARLTLARPVAKLLHADGAELLSLDRVVALLGGSQLVVDGCRRCVQQGDRCVRYGTRPVLFGLIRRLAEAAPDDVSRDELIRAGFGMRRASDSLRARLRVAIARLRKQLAGLAELRATAGGFVLLPHAPPALVLLPPLDDDAAGLLALVSDGQAWSSSALALALGASQRGVQRALVALASAGKVSSLGRGKNRRWLAPPLHAFATHLLLPVSSPES